VETRKKFEFNNSRQPLFCYFCYFCFLSRTKSNICTMTASGSFLALLIAALVGGHVSCFQAVQLYHRQSTRLNSIPTAFDTLTSGLASICRLPRGVTVRENVAPSTDLLTLFDIENDASCRLVRERLTELDLNFRIIPSSPNSKVFTDPSYKYSMPNDTPVPTLVINDRKQISGSSEIVKFLEKSYGSGEPDEDADDRIDIKEQALELLDNVGNMLAGLLRWGRGCQVSPAASKNTALEPLIMLYSYEGNQFCRLVREVMTELDLVYEVKSAGKNSPRREELARITGGSTQCPYLIDPNTAESMPESKDMIAYLYKTYAKYTPPSEILQFASDSILPLFKPLLAYLTKLQAGAMSEDSTEYDCGLSKAKAEIESEIQQAPVVVYTYELSPFSWETKALLDRLGIQYREMSLGKEWFPGFIAEGGSQKRAALLEMTGQSSLPHVFIRGNWIGGLFDGKPGLVPSLNDGSFWQMLNGVQEQANGAKQQSFFDRAKQAISDAMGEHLSNDCHQP
jgi:anaphase-promoting complex subunit 7